MSEYIQGLVSVIIPTYKRIGKLDRAIKSVLTQTYSKLELLLINDNIPGDEFTATLMEGVKKYESDARFHLILQEKHINGAVARNVGIKKAKGEFIAFLDDDDWWKPEKIEKQVRELSLRSNEWGAVSCRIEQYDSNKIIAKLPKFKDGYVYKDVLMLKCNLGTSTLMLRHVALDSIKYFDENLLRHQDYQLLVDFTFKYQLYQIDDYLHCCDVSDEMNRPDAKTLLWHKKRFFKSVESVLNTLTDKERKAVYAIHHFEIGYAYAKEKNFLKAIANMSYVLMSSLALKETLKKIIRKVQTKILISIF